MVITTLQARKRKHGDVKSLADKGSDTEWRNGDLNPGKLIPEPGSCLVWGGTCPEMAKGNRLSLSFLSLYQLTSIVTHVCHPTPHPHCPPSGGSASCLVGSVCSWANLRELRPQRQEPRAQTSCLGALWVHSPGCYPLNPPPSLHRCWTACRLLPVRTGRVAVLVRPLPLTPEQSGTLLLPLPSQGPDQSHLLHLKVLPAFSHCLPFILHRHPSNKSARLTLFWGPFLTEPELMH